MFLKNLTFIFLCVSSSFCYSEKYSWRGCEKRKYPPTCEKFPKPPLVILSLDGFGADYLNLNIVQTFDHIAACGAKSTKMYPVYPSLTYPNHISIATGLYPQNHGIVDEKIYDEGKQEYVDIRNAANARMFYNNTAAKMIWDLYKEQENSKDIKIFGWPGADISTVLQSEHFENPQPEESFRDKLVKIMELLKNQTTGLILAHHSGMEQVGYSNLMKNGKIDRIKGELEEIDADLDFFMRKLNEAEILECVNLVFVSDHGMQQINKSIKISSFLTGILSEKVKMNEELFVSIHWTEENKTEEKHFFDKISCTNNDIKVHNLQSMPYRRKYSSSINSKIGKLIIEGNPGITFSHKTPRNQGDHGYDFNVDSMHAIFFARGPGIKKGTQIEPFQNVELMNLFIDLLEIPKEEKLKNDGNLEFFDGILAKPRKELVQLKEHIRECEMLTHTQKPKNCGDSVKNAPTLRCSKTGRRLPFVPLNSENSDNFCYESYCQDNIVKHSEFSNVLTVFEAMTSQKSGFNNGADLRFYDENYARNKNDSEKCENLKNSTSISVRKTLVDSFFDFPPLFVEKILSPLDKLTAKYLNSYEILFIISGTTIDSNYDGKIDSSSEIPENQKPTHFYRIFLSCSKSGWKTINPPKCKNVAEMQTLSFIFPIIAPKSWNCTDSNEILIDYLAQISDIEKLTGMKLQLEGATNQQNVLIRQQINSKLWNQKKLKKTRKNGAGNLNFWVIFVVIGGVLSDFI